MLALLDEELGIFTCFEELVLNVFPFKFARISLFDVPLFIMLFSELEHDRDINDVINNKIKVIAYFIFFLNFIIFILLLQIYIVKF